MAGQGRQFQTLSFSIPRHLPAPDPEDVLFLASMAHQRQSRWYRRFTCGFQRTMSPSTVTVWEQNERRQVKRLASPFIDVTSLLMERPWMAPPAVR